MKNLDDILAMAGKVQDELSKAQANLDKIEVDGVSGGGLVKVKATAKGRVVSVEINESLLQPSEKQMVEDLVAAAFNDARGKADQASNTEMQRIQQGIGLPPGFNLPFS